MNLEARQLPSMKKPLPAAASHMARIGLIIHPENGLKTWPVLQKGTATHGEMGLADSRERLEADDCPDDCPALLWGTAKGLACTVCAVPG